MKAATHHSAIGKLRPIAQAHDARIAGPYKENAVGIAAERKLFFDSNYGVSETLIRK
jgi:hypothetical protein